MEGDILDGGQKLSGFCERPTIHFNRGPSDEKMSSRERIRSGLEKFRAMLYTEALSYLAKF